MKKESKQKIIFGGIIIFILLAIFIGLKMNRSESITLGEAISQGGLLNRPTICDPITEPECTFTPNDNVDEIITVTRGEEDIVLNKYNLLDNSVFNILTLPMPSTNVIPSLSVVRCLGFEGRDVAYIAAGNLLFELDLNEVPRFILIPRAEVLEPDEIWGLDCLNNGNVMISTKDKKMYQYTAPTEEFHAPGKLEEHLFPASISISSDSDIPSSPSSRGSRLSTIPNDCIRGFTTATMGKRGPYTCGSGCPGPKPCPGSQTCNTDTCLCEALV